MADRDRYEGYGPDRDRWRDRHREPGWRTDDEPRSWASEDYGRGRHREGEAYEQGAGPDSGRDAGRRPLPHEERRAGAHRDTGQTSGQTWGQTWGQARTNRDQTGREDFGHYGQTGGGGDYGRQQRGRGYGGAGLDQANGQSGQSGHEPERGGQRDYGHGREGRGRRRAAGEGMTLATHADFEPDYLHWRNTQMQKLDQEYLRWREERRSKFAKDFDEWRRTQGARQDPHFPTGSMQTAGQGSSGGVFPEQAGGREDKKS